MPDYLVGLGVDQDEGRGRRRGSVAIFGALLSSLDVVQYCLFVFAVDCAGHFDCLVDKHQQNCSCVPASWWRKPWDVIGQVPAYRYQGLLASTMISASVTEHRQCTTKRHECPQNIWTVFQCAQSQSRNHASRQGSGGENLG